MFKRLSVLMILIIFLITGCEQYDIVDKSDKNYPIITPFPLKETEEIFLYYPDEKMQYLVSEPREIEKEEQESFEKIIIEELLRGPMSDGRKSIIPRGTKLLSIDVVSETAYVSFSEDITKGSTDEAQEALILYSIVNTLTGIDGIDSVQILINGKYREFFHEYYRIGDPLSASSLIVKEAYKSPMDTVIRYYENLKNQDYTKAIDLLNTYDRQSVSYTTVKLYLQKSYKEMIDYRINHYYISKYDRDVRLDTNIDIINKDSRVDNRFDVYYLTYKDKMFKIDRILE